MNVPAHRGASRLGSVAIGIILLLVAAACAVSLMAAFLGAGRDLARSRSPAPSSSRYMGSRRS
jgi:flagellar basal body-associated protein FliL